MNAVNLIPSDRRTRQVGVSVSPMTLGVIGALVIVLAAAVVYVFAVNDVRERKSELARVTANAASWQAAANSYAQYVSAAQQQKQQLTDVEQLVTGRFPWSLLLSQIGGVLPADAALTSLQATAPSPTSSIGAASTAPGVASTSPSTSGAQPVQITGCAASESAVAATMVALRRVHGVSSVSLASTSDSSAGSSGSGSSNGGSGSSPGGGTASSTGGCNFPVNFSLSLILGSSSTGPSASGSASAPATESSTTAAATPTSSSAATPSTGSAQ